MTSKEIAKTEPMLPAIQAAVTMQETIRDVLAPGETLTLRDLPQMKLPSGTSTSWELPNGQPVKTLQCVILYRKPFRAYWRSSFDESGGGSPPDCASDDTLTGTGDNGTGNGTHDCLTCPLSQFKSAPDGYSQACSLLTTLYLLHESSGMPIVLKLGVTSYNPAKQYAVQTRSGWHSVTEIGLQTATSRGGIAYPVATFKELRPLTEEEESVVLGMRTAMMPFFKRHA